MAQSISRSRRRWTVALVVAVWARIVFSGLVNSFTYPKSAANTGITQATYYVQLLLTLTVFGLAGAILVLFGRSIRATHGVALVAILLPWGYLVFRNEYGDYPVIFIVALLYPAIVIAVWALQPSLKDLEILGYLVGATAVVSIAMGLFGPAAGILRDAELQTSVAEKQILSSGILIGPFDHGNHLGRFLAMGAASVLMITNRTWRWLLFAVCAYAALWSASRSALATLAVLLLVVLILSATSAWLRPVAGVFAAIAVMAVALITPLVTKDPEAFTGRAFIWHQALAAWADHQTFGMGSNWFTRILGTTENFGFAADHGHNEFVHVLATGGLVLAVLVGFAFATLLRAATHRARFGQPNALYFVIALFGSCWLEVAFAFVDFEFLFPVAVMPAAFVLFAREPDGQDLRNERDKLEPAHQPTSLHQESMAS